MIESEEEIDYTEWLDIRTEVKKLKRKTLDIQRLAKKGYTYKTDDPYDGSWYCRKGGNLKRVGEKRPRNLKTRRNVPTNYQNIVSKTESEEFDQEKEEKVYTEPREIIDKEATYPKVDLQGNRTPVAAPKDQSHVSPSPNIAMKPITSKPTATEVLDAYYNLDKTIEEPFDKAISGFNEEQENEIEILLQKVVAECEFIEVEVGRSKCVEKEVASDHCPESIDMELAEGTIDVGDHYQRKVESHKKNARHRNGTKTRLKWKMTEKLKWKTLVPVVQRKPKDRMKKNYLMIE
ncbi:hypothetical protein F8M41_025378 [Gigaspora margarita]|uniref:Uncharacterized protein n=1 Tax=Gigaspora margarita TaxID=4874 RepID=A0A8H3XIL9_GIGMA|nr:hypothetical protein F8M41_025378 [Gigaspora margarita]